MCGSVCNWTDRKELNSCCASAHMWIFNFMFISYGDWSTSYDYGWRPTCYWQITNKMKIFLFGRTSNNNPKEGRLTATSTSIDASSVLIYIHIYDSRRQLSMADVKNHRYHRRNQNINRNMWQTEERNLKIGIEKLCTERRPSLTKLKWKNKQKPSGSAVLVVGYICVYVCVCVVCQHCKSIKHRSVFNRLYRRRTYFSFFRSKQKAI